MEPSSSGSRRDGMRDIGFPAVIGDDLHVSGARTVVKIKMHGPAQIGFVARLAATFGPSGMRRCQLHFRVVAEQTIDFAA
ncbi:hypothetical protein GCM10025771_31670 [Niveibacterium umoris]